MNAVKIAAPMAIVVAVGLMVAACAPTAPTQVESTAPANPTVTYKYSGDNELQQSNQKAATYCNQYQSAAQAKTYSSEIDGSKRVTYECLPATVMHTLPPPYDPSISYTYMTDLELAEAARKAQIYCTNHGSQQMTSTTSANTNGTRNVSFKCE